MMTNDKMIRPCGSTYAFCTGICEGCSVNNTYATNSTSNDSSCTIGQPTKESYEFSKSCMKDLSSWMHASRKRQDELLDELCKERENEKSWKELYDGHAEVIRKYEIYEQLKANIS